MPVKISPAMEEIQGKEALKIAFFESAADMQGVLDGDKNLLLVSPSWEKAVGWNKNELTGRPFALFIHPEDAKSLESKWKKLQSGPMISSDNRFLCKDGSYKWVSLHGTKDKQYIFLSGRDASQHAETQMLLKKAQLAVEQADKAKSEFLSNISHEIRTPLNAVIGFSELLESSVKDEKSKDHVSAITASARRLLALLNSILDLSKIEAGMMSIQLGSTDLKRLIFDVGQVFQKEIGEKNLGFTVDYAKDTQGSFLLDECRVRQVLLNIVGNAVKFTEEGGITIRVKTAKEKPPSGCTDLSICVEDTGIGIPKGEQKAVFESFVQQSGQSNRKYGGTGLGLSISNKLIHLMNGELKLKSTVGKGSVFTIVLREVQAEESSVDSNDVKWEFMRETPAVSKGSQGCMTLSTQCKEYIRSDILPLSEYLGKSVKVSQVNKLADILTKEVENHGSPRLRAYGEVLRDAGDKFDIPTLNAVINSMGRYLEDLLAER